MTSTGRVRPARVAVVAALFAVTACGESPAPVVATHTPSPGATQPSSLAVPDLKPMLHGLIDRQGPPAAALRDVVPNFVVNVKWSDLQPAPGPLVDTSAIDQAVALARQMNAVPGHPTVGLKIRLFAGIDAPTWVKALAGGPVDVVSGAVAGTIGRFWTAPFGAAYADVWTRLAQKYDTVPEIHEITASRCMTFYVETMIRQTNDPVTVRNLLDAGFTIDADHACITQEINLATVWHHTRVGVAFNPYEVVVGDGLHYTDVAYTLAMMQYCRMQLGPQCVLENNSIRTPLQAGLYARMYTAMITLGAPLSFQTAALARVGDLATTLDWAASVGANAVELPQGYALPATRMAAVDAELHPSPV